MEGSVARNSCDELPKRCMWYNKVKKECRALGWFLYTERKEDELVKNLTVRLRKEA